MTNPKNSGRFLLRLSYLYVYKIEKRDSKYILASMYLGQGTYREGAQNHTYSQRVNQNKPKQKDI